jgi:hypothetical protein
VARFELDIITPHAYLHHRSELGEFVLASDSVIPAFLREPRMAHIIEQVPAAERERFLHIRYTIGGMMVFPAIRVDGKMTINGARGFHPRIKDRFDLTVECFRRHYADESSPLGDTLARYADFFGLFGDFAGYVDFFHLQDLASTSPATVTFFLPFEGFNASPLLRRLISTSPTANAPLSSSRHETGELPRSRPVADRLAVAGGLSYAATP